MFLSLRKYTGTLAGIIVFFHLLLLNSKPVVADHTATYNNNSSFAQSHGRAMQSGTCETQFKSTSRIKIPNEKRKYCLYGTNPAFINGDEEIVVFSTEISLFIKNHRQDIRSSSVSLSLLRAPPVA